MSKTKETAKQVTPAAQTPVSMPVQDLKSRFKARSIPLETDFADIIDVADCGRKAVGLSPDFPVPARDTGLILDNITGQLKVLPDTNKGIIVDDSGVGVNLGFGLTHNNNAIDVSNMRISFEKAPTRGRYEIAWGPIGVDNYVEISIFAKTISPASQERFKITAIFNDEDNYILSIGDAFRTVATTFVFGSVYLNKSDDGNICVELEMTHGSTVSALVSYSIFDVNCNISQLTPARTGTRICTATPDGDKYYRNE